MKRLALVSWCVVGIAAFVGLALAADVAPTAIEQPGTQPLEVNSLESPDKCDNCHGGYNEAVEPAFTWRGSMMGNASRDPIFWATLAVAEQDFDGAGDLCLRCHTTGAWYGGRSEPTDGSGLAANDADGVDCDTCHKMTDPDNSEHLGEMTADHVANDGGSPAEGYYGSGILSLWGGSEKLGPYATAAARHQYDQSVFHRSRDFCGSCHDVSNPVVGDLAPGSGRQDGIGLGSESLTSPIADKAAFNFPPYMYGVVERTWSEFKAGLISQTLVSDYPSLPTDLRAGALAAAYQSATATGGTGDYADGTERYFTCQTCHMRPVQGPGCNKKGVEVRDDLPLHDMTGGNHWIADLIRYQDGKGLLRLGGGLTALQVRALEAGQVRAMKQLSSAATLHLTGNTLKVVNHTGHKLISGYPEGRRMWLRTTWYDDQGGVVREDGAYGTVASVTDPATGATVDVSSILDLHDANTRVYEAHYGITQAWAARLVNELGAPSGLVLSYDRVDGTPDVTLGELAASSSGSHVETFHFVLNDIVASDNRIPPYGFDAEEAELRNALPVPASLYLGADGYRYYDELELSPPTGAVYATIELLYQGTSWEYVQFLDLANDGTSPFLGEEGSNMLEAWLHTGMCAPYVMASTTWGTPPQDPPEPPPPPSITISVPVLTTWAVDKRGSFTSVQTAFKVGDKVGLLAPVVDENAATPSGAQVFVDISFGGTFVATVQGFSDANGRVELIWKSGRKASRGTYTAKVVNVLKSGYTWDAASATATFTLN